MNPEIAWRDERANVDHLLARMASDPDFRHRVSHDPATIGDFIDDRVKRHAAPTKCGPLRTSCPPGKTCANKKSCVKTSISIA
jgi:hypothetical protein